MNLSDLLTRGVVTATNGAKKMRELVIELFAGETRGEIEHMEPYGFTSEPKSGAECAAIFPNGDRSHGIVVVVADRRYRPTDLKTGEVAIFDDQGQIVILKREGIEVKTSGYLKAEVGGETTLKSGGNVNVTAPLTQINGNLTVTGAITGRGGLAISGGSGASVEGSLKTTGDVQAGSISLQNHVHGDSPKPS